MSTDISIFTEQGFATTFKIAEAMVKSGILPRGIDNPYKAFAIIQKGREMGVEPMRALTGIYLIEGKTVVSPELKLECFRARGGKVQWLESNEKVAKVKLVSADGTEHVEVVTIQDMAAAGLTSKDNWRKYPKSMLRARCIAFALRAMGEGDGSYTPDEMGAETDEKGEATYTPPRTVVESPERIAGTHGEEAAPAAGKAAPEHGPAANGASIGTPPTPAPSSNGAWKPGRAGTAAAVAPTGGPITPDQTKAIHTLLSRVGNITNEAYRKQVAVYRQADGTPCVDPKTNEGTSKLLSKEQASHLISRLEAKCDRQDQRAGAGVDLDAAVPSRNGSPTTHNFGKSTTSIDDLDAARIPFGTATDSDLSSNFVYKPTTSMDDLLQKAFDTDIEQSEWIRGLFGVEHPAELDQKETATMLQLLICYSQGPDVYDTALTQARERGLVR